MKDNISEPTRGVPEPTPSTSAPVEDQRLAQFFYALLLDAPDLEEALQDFVVPPMPRD
jgi:hypothetical protein